MDPGVDGGILTVTARLRGLEEPQELLAVTVMFPLVALEVPKIELDVENPLHPLGRVQV
jgi:hypothetical protein